MGESNVVAALILFVVVNASTSGTQVNVAQGVLGGGCVKGHLPLRCELGALRVSHRVFVLQVSLVGAREGAWVWFRCLTVAGLVVGDVASVGVVASGGGIGVGGVVWGWWWTVACGVERFD